MRFNLLKTLGLAKPLAAILKSPVAKPLTEAALNLILEQSKPALKNDAARVIGALPNGHIADQMKQQATAGIGDWIDTLKVTL